MVFPVLFEIAKEEKIGVFAVRILKKHIWFIKAEESFSNAFYEKNFRMTYRDFVWFFSLDNTGCQGDHPLQGFLHSALIRPFISTLPFSQKRKAIDNSSFLWYNKKRNVRDFLCFWRKVCDLRYENGYPKDRSKF